MDELVAMGFGQEAARTALSMNNQNFDNALTMLLSQASQEQALNFPVATATPGLPPPVTQPAVDVHNLAPLQQPVPQPPSGGNSDAAAAHPPTSISAYPESPGARDARDPAFETLAGGLAADRPAVNALVELVDKLLANPDDQTISVLLLKGKWAPIKAAACDAGLTFLQHLGYALRSGFWCLSADAAAAKSGVGSAQKTWLAARGALGRAMGDELYLLAESLAESKAAAVSAAVAARHAMRSKPAKAEPEPPAPCTRLVFHPKGSTPVQPLKEVLERRFAPDDLLSDAVHFLGSLPEESSVVEGSHSWELIASGHDAPFWWCHGLEIVDVTMRPERVLTIADARRTLQGLELWPSAQLAIRPLPLGADQPSSPTAPAVCRNGTAASTTSSGTSFSGGQTAGPRPTPADVLKSVVGRPTKGVTGASGNGSGGSGSAGAPQVRSHYNVQASAAAAAEARFAAAAANKPTASKLTPKSSNNSTEKKSASIVAPPSAGQSPPVVAATAGTSVPSSGTAVASGFPGWGAPPANSSSSFSSAAASSTSTSAAPAPPPASGEALAALMAMGFGEAAARKALADAGGNQERAVDMLLG